MHRAEKEEENFHHLLLPHLSSKSVLSSLCVHEKNFITSIIYRLGRKRERAKDGGNGDEIFSSGRQFSYSCVCRINLNFKIDVLKCYDQHFSTAVTDMLRKSFIDYAFQCCLEALCSLN